MFIKNRRQLIALFFMPALLAGIIFFACGFTKSVQKNVTVNGVSVGGMPIAEAAGILRKDIEKELKTKTLTIRGEKRNYEFSYPEIYYKDDIFRLLKNANKGDNLTSSVTYYLCGINDIAQGICLNESVSAVEPSAKFNLKGEPFTYDCGQDGKEAVKSKLIEDINNSLKGGFEPITVTYKLVNRTKTIEDVKKGTCRLAGFTTYFDGTNLTRASNIRLAAARLNGKILQGKKTLSFNDIVGERTKSRGFLPAKIIENGEYTEGVGGGVCQVSTTLYNCALFSGLEIAEYHPHSLAVGYVPPSRDAMVSGNTCDLKITNPNDSPVYIRAKTGKNYVSFEIYGVKSGAEYSLSSTVTGNIPAPIENTDDPLKAREGKDGITSESYLTVTRGNYKKTVLLRKDKYAPVKGLKYEENAGENTEENAVAEG